MTEKQRTAVIALLRLTYYQDEIILHDKELQNDILSVLEGILDNEIEKKHGNWKMYIQQMPVLLRLPKKLSEREGWLRRR